MIAESSELVGGDVTFVFPERIEDANECCTLSGEIVEVEQLKSAEAGGSKSGLDVFFVKEGLEFAGSDEEIMGEVSHMVLFEGVLKDLKIFGFQNAGIFYDLFEVRIDTPLANFVADNGYLVS